MHVVSQGEGYQCELFLFILIQVLYLVGVLLMTFDLLTSGHSQGNGFPPVYISKVLSATISDYVPAAILNVLSEPTLGTDRKHFLLTNVERYFICRVRCTLR